MVAKKWPAAWAKATATRMSELKDSSQMEQCSGCSEAGVNNWCKPQVHPASTSCIAKGALEFCENNKETLDAKVRKVHTAWQQNQHSTGAMLVLGGEWTDTYWVGNTDEDLKQCSKLAPPWILVMRHMFKSHAMNQRNRI